MKRLSNLFQRRVILLSVVFIKQTVTEDKDKTISEEDAEHIRIAPDLADEIRANALNEDAGFAFVDQIQETEEKGVLEVVFELPHGSETFSRKFERMRADDTPYPSIETLYELDDSATLREPRSILYTSIPIVAEEGYRLPNMEASVGEPDKQGMNPRPQPQAGQSSRSGWENKRNFYEKIDFDPKYKVVPIAVALVGLLSGLLAGGTATILIWIVTAILSYGVYQWFHRLRVPDDAEHLDNDEASTLTSGDILILDQSGAQNPRERTVIKVEAVKQGKVKGELSSGQSVVVNPRGWRVDGPVGKNKHDNAYYIPEQKL